MQRLSLLSLFVISACATPLDNSPLKSDTPERIDITFDPLSAWTERQFVASTHYELEKQSSKTVLVSNSQKSASLLYKKIRIDLNTTPFINWHWLVHHTYINNHHEKEKHGDDFPARIYIAIKPKLGRIKPRALTYVWASHAKKFSHWKNPFSSDVEVFALETGETLAQTWVSEKRNLQQDLHQFFGQHFDSIEGIGVMTDSDNSKTSGQAAFSNIFFSAD
ncbi:MAG: DUF3047 domain-containing protein [Arenicella sp.]